MHVYTLVKLKLNQIGLLIVELRPLDNSIHSQVKRACTEWDWIMPRHTAGREPEVEEDDSRVVVAVRKRETVIYFKRWRRRWKKPVNVVTL